MKEHKKINLVLLPGLDGTGKLFQPFTSMLTSCAHTQVIAYPQDRLQSIAEHAQFAATHFPDGQITLLAESFSGLVALALLARHDTRINAVIFCAAFAEPPHPLLLRLARLLPIGLLMQTAPIFLLRKFCLGSWASADLLLRLKTVLAETNPALLTHRLQLVATEKASAQERFNVPCWYFQAKNDRLVPPGAAEWFKSRFTQFQLEQIDGPHFLLQAESQECARRVERILKKIEKMQTE